MYLEWNNVGVLPCLQERDLYYSLAVDGRATLKWLLKKWVSIRGIMFIRLMIENNGDPLVNAVLNLRVP